MASRGKGIVWFQKQFSLGSKGRGCYYINDIVKKELPEISSINIGTLNLFIQHTSASITLNECWDPSVKDDMEMMLNRLVPENLKYKHSCEGPDDMEIESSTERGSRVTSRRTWGLTHEAVRVLEKLCGRRPAHVKNALLGSSITIPISNGKLAMGTWQGIWYCEHRNSKHNRSLMATIQGCESTC